MKIDYIGPMENQVVSDFAYKPETTLNMILSKDERSPYEDDLMIKFIPYENGGTFELGTFPNAGDPYVCITRILISCTPGEVSVILTGIDSINNKISREHVIVPVNFGAVNEQKEKLGKEMNLNNQEEVERRKNEVINTIRIAYNQLVSERSEEQHHL